MISGCISEKTGIVCLINSFKDTYRKMIWIQGRIRTQLVIKDSKIEVITNYWEKTFGKLMIQAGRINDIKMKK